MPQERTHVERHTIRMYERREETWQRLNRDRVGAFVKLFLMAMLRVENAHRQGCQHPVTTKMLNKTLVRRIIPSPQQSVDHGRGTMADYHGTVPRIGQVFGRSPSPSTGAPSMGNDSPLLQGHETGAKGGDGEMEGASEPSATGVICLNICFYVDIFKIHCESRLL